MIIKILLSIIFGFIVAFPFLVLLAKASNTPADDEINLEDDDDYMHQRSTWY